MILSIEQRINLTILLGALECKTLAETRVAWRLIDRLELTEDEKQAVDYRADTFTWNNDRAPAPKEIEVTETERAHLERALGACPRWLPGPMRRWLEPLLEQMPEPSEPPTPNMLAQGAARG